MIVSRVWEKLFDDYDIGHHDFNKSPFFITNRQIKSAYQHLLPTNDNYWMSVSRQKKRESRPGIFIKNNLFLLPVKRGQKAIIRGEGYFDIPEIDVTRDYSSQLDFQLDSIGGSDSQIQYLDFAHASGLMNSFIDDDSLHLTLRGRFYMPLFDFNIASQRIRVQNAQIHIDAGYESKDKLVLVKIKESLTQNLPLRQLYYPFRYWAERTDKEISLVLFEKRKTDYLLWQYRFKDTLTYGGLELVKSGRYRIIGPLLSKVLES
jgi:hypothetical protein